MVARQVMELKSQGLPFNKSCIDEKPGLYLESWFFCAAKSPIGKPGNPDGYSPHYEALPIPLQRVANHWL